MGYSEFKEGIKDALERCQAENRRWKICHDEMAEEARHWKKKYEELHARVYPRYVSYEQRLGCDEGE